MTTKPKAAKPRKRPAKPKAASAAYHHGDLAPALRQAARELLEEDGLEALSLRSVARRAGVSHAAPYRHFPSREALLADIAREGFRQLRADIAQAAQAPGQEDDRIAHIGGAYMRFAARQGALLRLMFGRELPNRSDFSDLEQEADAIGAEIGTALGDPALGLAVWAAVHGLAMLVLENIIDLGQRQAGMAVLPTRAEILLRSLFSRESDEPSF